MKSEQETDEGPYLAVVCEEHGVIATAGEPEIDEDALPTAAKMHLVVHRLKRPLRGSRCEVSYGEVEYAE
jgi:hypothetical protein